MLPVVSLMVLLLVRNVICCWLMPGSSISLSSELSCSTDCFEWLYFRLALCELLNNCCFIAFFDNVPVFTIALPLPFWPCTWTACFSNFSTCPADIRGAIVIGGWFRFCFVEGMLIFRTDSLIICRIVFRNAFLNSVVLKVYDVVSKSNVNEIFISN